MIIPYASRTGTRKNLAALRAAGWRLMVSATGELRPEGFRYCLDNGAWTAFQRSTPFDATAFETALSALGDQADFVVAPDIVCGGLESLRFTESWLPRLVGRTRLVLIAVQPGIQPTDIQPLLGRHVGIFVGGDDIFKEETLEQWTGLAHRTGAYVHVGRVNTERRIQLCMRAGANSFDGTSATRYLVTLPLLDAARRRPVCEDLSMGSAADEYLTPEVIADAFEELGGVDLDPCANWYSRVNARKYFMTESNFNTPRPDWSIVDPKRVVVVPDGSWDYSWAGQFAFCNGPYSTPHAWTEKAHTAQEAVLLVPVMTSEKWWHQDLVGPNPANAILFWEGRLQFLEYDPVKDRVKRAGSARFSSALAYWGPRPGAFADVFIGCGWCVAPRHVDVARL